MFNLQGSEIIIVLLLALVVLGPEKLPDAMRKMGQAYAELKKMSSGFQSEFRAAVDEPMREIRDTANTLRDSADFTKLQAGDREEKPKSAEMGEASGVTDLAPGDPDEVPTTDIPTFDTPASAPGPEAASDSEPAPFEDAPTDGADDEAPADSDPRTGGPFSGQTTTAPRSPAEPEVETREPVGPTPFPAINMIAKPPEPETAVADVDTPETAVVDSDTPVTDATESDTAIADDETDTTR